MSNVDRPAKKKMGIGLIDILSYPNVVESVIDVRSNNAHQSLAQTDISW